MPWRPSGLKISNPGLAKTERTPFFRRSFSVLCLAALAEKDIRAPFLSGERYRTLLERAPEYLKRERDLRGFDASKGWIHATALTADLLAALAKNRLFTGEEQADVLKAVALKLASAPVCVYE